MGKLTLRYFGPVVWETMLPESYKGITDLEKFKNDIKDWIPVCKCRLCKTYIAGLGFSNISKWTCLVFWAWGKCLNTFKAQISPTSQWLVNNSWIVVSANLMYLLFGYVVMYFYYSLSGRGGGKSGLNGLNVQIFIFGYHARLLTF